LGCRFPRNPQVCTHRGLSLHFATDEDSAGVSLRGMIPILGNRSVIKRGVQLQLELTCWAQNATKS
jgi:hypothetical protein